MENKDLSQIKIVFKKVFHEKKLKLFFVTFKLSSNKKSFGKNIKLILKVDKSLFKNFILAPEVYEVIGSNNTIDTLVEKKAFYL